MESFPCPLFARPHGVRLAALSALLGALALPGAAPAAHAAAPAPRPAGSQPASRYPEPLVRNLVTQDRSVRIEEQQVRGATTRIEVKPLHGGAPYSIVPPSPAQPGPGSLQGHMEWRIGTFR